MRILHVIESFGAGSMQVVLTISERLAADGHELAIVHGQVPESPRDPRSLVPAGVELFAVDWPRTASGQLTAAREVRRRGRAWRPDVVHLHSSFAGVVGAGALRGLVPLVYTPHGYSFTRRRGPAFAPVMLRWVERAVARRVDTVAAVSHCEADLARNLGAPRVAVVPNGIPELDEPTGTTEPRADPPTVAAVGRIDPARRPLSAARILGSVVDVARPVWVGGGRFSDDSVAALERAGVQVTGWLERSEVLMHLSGATACLHWSAWDAQPLSILEAVANDVIVVASDIPANRELLGSRQVCQSEQAASELLRLVVTDPEIRGELRANQRARCRGYTATRMAREWLELYKRVSARAA